MDEQFMFHKFIGELTRTDMDMLWEHISSFEEFSTLHCNR